MPKDYNLNSELLQKLYFEMKRIRLLEEAIVEHYAEQEMRCPVHLSIGQEAIAVGVCQTMTTSDKVFSNHRCHAHYLAKGGDMKKMMAELYGKVDGCIGGRGGSMHLMDLSVGMMTSVPIVGSSVPLAVGSALADQRTGKDTVTVVFVGDAAVEEGVFYESGNFAVLRSLPVVFVCENNLYSVYTPLHERQPDRPLTDLVLAHGMPSAHGDGNNAAEVFKLTEEAIERARTGGGPTFLQFDTYRWREHCGPNYDNDAGYRDESEYLEWREKCPIESLQKRLLDGGQMDAAAEDARTAEITAEIKAAFDFAKSSPLPNLASATDHVYA